uniref:Uncharacterized protein n=1 Tax=Anopheles atroparvus TaxID=41427 RepID=A0A182JDL1_ANOAO
MAMVFGRPSTIFAGGMSTPEFVGAAGLRHHLSFVSQTMHIIAAINIAIIIIISISVAIIGYKRADYVSSCIEDTSRRSPRSIGDDTGRLEAPRSRSVAEEDTNAVDMMTVAS